MILEFRGLKVVVLRFWFYEFGVYKINVYKTRFTVNMVYRFGLNASGINEFFDFLIIFIQNS